MTKLPKYSIDTNDYDFASYGVRVFDESKGFGDINDLVGEALVNDTNEEQSDETNALSMAIEELINNHESELLKLFNQKLKEIKEEDY